MPSITLDDVKAQLNISSSADDVELQVVLDAAVEMVEGLTGTPVEPASKTWTFINPQSEILVLPHAPVVSVGTLTIATLADSVVVTSFTLDAEAGIVRLYQRPHAWSTVITVAYTAGWSTVPAAVRLAVMIIAAHLWETQRGAAPLPMPGGEYNPNPGIGYALPSRALELLAPYLRAKRVG